MNKGSQTSLTYTFGGTGAAFARGTNGTLILSVGAIASLGAASSGERFLINGTAPTAVNNLVSGVVAQDRGNSNAGDFVTYGAPNGFAAATADLSNTFSGSTNAKYVSISSGTSTSGATAAYALKVGGATVTNTGNTITLGGSAAGVAGLILNGGTISGGSLTTPTSVATEFTVYTSGVSAISSSINTATSQAGMSVFGPGTLDFSSSTGNSFTGGLRVNNSTVIANNDNQLGGSTSSITLTGGTLQTSGTVGLGGSGSRAIALAAGQGNTGGTFNVTGGTTTYTNNSTGSKVLSGTGSLTKTGTGTLVLAGNTTNTYTGGTTVTAGTLLVDTTVSSTNSGTGTGSVTVSGANTTLGGAGQITPGGANTITIGSGSILAPGDSGIGTLVVNAANSSATGLLTFSSGAKLSFDLNGTNTTSDTLQLLNGTSGAIAFNTNVITFAVTGSLTSGQTFILFDGTNNNQFTGLAVDGSNKITSGLSFTGLSGAFQTNSYLTLAGGDIVLNAVPEPAPWLLLAFSLTTVMVFRRRRA